MSGFQTARLMGRPFLSVAIIFQIFMSGRFIRFRYSLHSLVRILETYSIFNPLNAELNPTCYLLALLGAHHYLQISRIRVKYLIYWLPQIYL